MVVIYSVDLKRSLHTYMYVEVNLKTQIVNYLHDPGRSIIASKTLR